MGNTGRDRRSRRVDLDTCMITLMEEHKSRQHNELRGVDIKDFPQEKQGTMPTKERSGTTGRRNITNVRATNKLFL